MSRSATPKGNSAVAICDSARRTPRAVSPPPCPDPPSPSAPGTGAASAPVTGASVARVFVAGGRTAPAPPAPPPAPPRDRCGSGCFATSSWVSRLRCSARWEALSPAIHPSTGPPALSSLPIHVCPAPKMPPPLLPTSSSPPPPFAPPLPTAVCSGTTKKRLSIGAVRLGLQRLQVLRRHVHGHHHRLSSAARLCCSLWVVDEGWPCCKNSSARNTTKAVAARSRRLGPCAKRKCVTAVRRPHHPPAGHTPG